DPKWQSLQRWTLAEGTTITAAVVLLSAGPTDPPVVPNAFNQWVGVMQRTAIITHLSWLVTFALKLAGEAHVRLLSTQDPHMGVLGSHSLDSW
ncbi:MAG: hypothetical protein M3Q45_09655, partial [Chloroflexota bacterium]|nr:hypothetical protein [Chloroflexota bacterium]